MKKKFNQQLLNEEIKKFKLLSEYDFYQEKKEMPEYKDLLLGNELEEADEAPADLKPEDNVDSAADNVAADLGVDAGTDAGADMPEPDAAEEPMEEPMPEPMEEPASDDVEVDVTSLVKGSEEAKDAADMASKNSEMLLQKLNDLEARMANMTAISDKIEGLEKEIIKRNPTPVEKLEMRSLSSAPFNQKLTDYWADKEGAYDVMNKKPKEYVLTKDDVDSTYSDAGVRKTFSIEDNPYDEESIKDYDEEDLY
jgi:hypothetical protein